ncbi:hypothetical protein J2S49_001666 [Arcanobacterium wilhelmae]|uniref:VCBS repeat-containing protein n=1 Tax=Arcanobacterium wilhelmae TaxID=1803177 RepID=A0ABT9NCZ5_9ACTO|nr:VCBS repeat-containing protein [Arcanobacterium wilhelmae]MDP9801590.1 hypothetical protein [Arcanobacterium wilhelmae]WFN90915.1 VCBS repeat-containing protein [Arcanobacterium wilhelmae]
MKDFARKVFAIVGVSALSVAGMVAPPSFAQSNSSQAQLAHRGSSQATASASWSLQNIGTGWASKVITHTFNAGDLDRNGYQDMMLTDTKGDLWLYPARSNTSFYPRKRVGYGWNGMRDIFGGVDFNGDGKVDILGIDNRGNLRFYAGLGNGYFAKNRVINTGWRSAKNVSLAQKGFNGKPIIMASFNGVLRSFATDGRGHFARRITYGSG